MTRWIVVAVAAGLATALAAALRCYDRQLDAAWRQHTIKGDWWAAQSR